MSEPRTEWEVRNPVNDGEPSDEMQSLDDPEVGTRGEAELSGDSGLDVDEAHPRGDEQDSSREEQSKEPEAQFPRRFEGVQMRMRKGKAGSCVIGVDIELAFDKAKPGGEELSSGAEDEMHEPEEHEPDGNSAEEASAEAGDQGDIGEEGLEADAGDQGDIGEEGLEADADDQGDGFEEEELEAEADDQGDGFEEEEPEARGFKSTALKAASGKGVAAAAPRKLRLSPRGAQFIAQFEGFRPKLYNDPAGHCTIGIGHLVHRGRCNGSEAPAFKKGLTRPQAYALLQRDVRGMETAVHGLGIPLNQNQFDALVSFTYNVGPRWTKKSGLRDALLARRYGDVPRELMKWVKAGGRVLRGLVNRRKAEGRLFAAGGKPVPPQKPGPQVVKVADVQFGKKNPSVLIVQKALAKAVGLDYSSGPGTFGNRTRKAYAEWQRKCGFSGSAADGKPGLKSLKKLGDTYGFKVLGGTTPPTRPPSGIRVPSPVPGLHA